MDVKEKCIAVRVTVEDRAKIADAAGEAGLSVGAFLRSVALGSAGARAVKRPRVERVELARLLGELGKLGATSTRSRRPSTAPARFRPRRNCRRCRPTSWRYGRR